MKVSLDKDLLEMQTVVTSNYPNDRERARGTVQVHMIQTIRNLQGTIQQLDKQNSKLQRNMFWLTIFTAILAIIQVYPLIQNIIYRK